VCIDVLVPFSEGRLVARIHELGEVLDEGHTGEGTRIRANVPARVAAESARFAVTALSGA
jgi:GTP-binding protein HflX